MSILLDILFPRYCFGCHHHGYYLCPICRSKIILKSIKPGDRLSLFRYNGPIKTIITELKFNFVSDVASEMAEFIAISIVTKYPNLLSYWQEKNFVLTPIPLHPRRQNWRGYNQSELVCHHLSQQLKLGYDSHVLVRAKYIVPQTKIHDKLLRRQNTISSFKLINNKYQNIILFDDVYTTGSTIRSAKSVFPKNTQIWTLTIAG